MLPCRYLINKKTISALDYMYMAMVVPLTLYGYQSHELDEGYLKQGKGFIQTTDTISSNAVIPFIESFHCLESWLI